MTKRIENLDKEIISLISERTKLFIQEIKNSGRLIDDTYSTLDEKGIFKLIEESNESPLPDVILKKIFNELISGSINLAKPQKVACLGPDGTFSHTALLEIFGESVQSVFQTTIAGVFQEVEKGRAPLGVVPVENSTEGAVTFTLDELLNTDLKVKSEKFLKISYCLLSQCDDIKQIKRLYALNQPFAQCKGWIKKNLPDVEIHYVNSTTQSADRASNDKTSAALASEANAGRYNLKILATKIEDSTHNYTRFFVIGKKDNPPTGNDKTSIILAVREKPGALYSVLKPFRDAGINLTKIESRPDKRKMWAYNFFIDFTGHREDVNVKDTIETIREEALFIKILGSYPAESI